MALWPTVNQVFPFANGQQISNQAITDRQLVRFKQESQKEKVEDIKWTNSRKIE
jgi:hypothetical protein